MARDISVEELRARIKEGVTSDEAAFDLMRRVAALANAADPATLNEARELVIRLLEHGEALSDDRELLDALVRQVGLYPYLDPRRLAVADLLAFEAHRPLDFPESDVVFHEAQGLVYRTLLEGSNVILSAPTSFGKSLVIDALLASGRYRNCVIVVPTIALLDETRRRLSRFNRDFKIITHFGQDVHDKNVFILTQERVIDYPDLPGIDLFVIDEFYKLDASNDPDRAYLLNQAFYRLWKTGAQFYFLGPNIHAIPADLPGTFDYHFIRSDFNTVAADITYVSLERQTEREALTGLCRDLTEPTLIYCRSPRRTRDVARWLLDEVAEEDVPELRAAAEWVGDHFNPEWTVAAALRRGVGVHHGRLPRSLAHFMVRAFNEGTIRFLVCTSTLIEGVNTSAKNVVIFDNRVAMSQFDYFTFSNIRGRSGRMLRHFVGHVYVFHEPPFVELPFVDFPALTQPESAPDSLLVQLDPEELTERSRERLEHYFENDLLPMEVLRANSGIDPERQLSVAEEIDQRWEDYAQTLTWAGTPAWDELSATCELIWDYLVEGQRMQAGVVSGRQLAFKLGRLAAHGPSAAFIRDLRGQAEAVDDAVEGALDFVRQWAGFRFPSLLGALDRIQAAVFRRHSIPPGNYTSYAAQVEGLFLPSPLVALDEYGVPTQLAMKLLDWLEPDGDLDAVLERLREIPTKRLDVTAFERDVIQDAQSTL